MKYYKSKIELDKELNEQIQLLDGAIERYDQGFTIEIKNISLRLRILLHDTSKSISLLKQLDLKNGNKFVDTSLGIPSRVLVLPYFALFQIGFDSNYNNFLPLLDEFPTNTRLVTFNQWWNKPVIKDVNGRYLTRKTLILNVSDTEGGAHVDGLLSDDDYVNIRYFNSVNTKLMFNGKELDAEHIIYASIRQIAHEIRKTLDKDYYKTVKDTHDNKYNSQFLGFVLIDESLPRSVKRIQRNELCPCGSKIKYKHCCHGRCLNMSPQ